MFNIKRIVSVIMIVVVATISASAINMEHKEQYKLSHADLNLIVSRFNSEINVKSNEYQTMLTKRKDNYYFTKVEMITLISNTMDNPQEFLLECENADVDIQYADGNVNISISKIIQDNNKAKISAPQTIIKEDVVYDADLFAGGKGSKFTYTTTFKKYTQPIYVERVGSRHSNQPYNSKFTPYTIKSMSFNNSPSPSQFNVWSEWLLTVTHENRRFALRNECNS